MSQKGGPFAAFLQLTARFDGAGERDFVHEIEFAAHGHAAGESRDSNAERLHQPGDIGSCGFAFHVGVCGQDDFRDVLGG